MPIQATSTAQNDTLTDDCLGCVLSPDCSRSTLDLLYSCGFTIFLSTWSALHINVLADCDTTWTVQIRKLKWMTVGVLIPEYVAVMAITEWWDARYLWKKMRHSYGLNVSKAFGRRRAHCWLGILGQEDFLVDSELLANYGRVCITFEKRSPFSPGWLSILHARQIKRDRGPTIYDWRDQWPLQRWLGNQIGVLSPNMLAGGPNWPGAHSNAYQLQR
jgi:hypothetical protein